MEKGINSLLWDSELFHTHCHASKISRNPLMLLHVCPEGCSPLLLWQGGDCLSYDHYGGRLEGRHLGVWGLEFTHRGWTQEAHTAFWTSQFCPRPPRLWYLGQNLLVRCSPLAAHRWGQLGRRDRTVLLFEVWSSSRVGSSILSPFLTVKIKR